MSVLQGVTGNGNESHLSGFIASADSYEAVMKDMLQTKGLPVSAYIGYSKHLGDYTIRSIRGDESAAAMNNLWAIKVDIQLTAYSSLITS